MAYQWASSVKFERGREERKLQKVMEDNAQSKKQLSAKFLKNLLT